MTLEDPLLLLTVTVPPIVKVAEQPIVYLPPVAIVLNVRLPTVTGSFTVILADAAVPAPMTASAPDTQAISAPPLAQGVRAAVAQVPEASEMLLVELGSQERTAAWVTALPRSNARAANAETRITEAEMRFRIQVSFIDRMIFRGLEN
jgi:hypothetical protein